MKQSKMLVSLKMFFALLIFNGLQLVLLAQDSTSSSTTTSTTSSNTRIDMNEGGAWYTSPWVWVIGAAVFILLLVALLRGGGNNRSDASRTDKVTVTKTVRHDTDTDVV
jgi:hypothetical protein